MIGFEASAGTLRLTDAVVLIDEADLPGVDHAARDLASDIAKVTGQPPIPHQAVSSGQDEAHPKTAIIIGSIESSSLLQTLAEKKLVEFSDIKGKWESFLTVVVENPLPGCEKALVIAGSDKRGAIFGAYTVSEQIGVSPYVLSSSLVLDVR